MNFIPRLLLILIGGIVLLFSQLHAYDNHHPNPMSFLNGHHKTHRSTRAAKHAKIPKIRLIDLRNKKSTKSSRKRPGRMYKRRKESKYIIKPEPFSIKSKKVDPELLGPQRTYSETNGTLTNKDTGKSSAIADSGTPSSTMTYGECIAMIGQERFDSYVEKYGSTDGALRRCLILKRVKG